MMCSTVAAPLPTDVFLCTIVLVKKAPYQCRAFAKMHFSINHTWWCALTQNCVWTSIVWKHPAFSPVPSMWIIRPSSPLSPPATPMARLPHRCSIIQLGRCCRRLWSAGLTERPRSFWKMGSERPLHSSSKKWVILIKTSAPASVWGAGGLCWNGTWNYGVNAVMKLGD